MSLIKKIVILRDVILRTQRDKSDISFYYPVDTLLEIMIDLMSVKTDSEDFNKYVLDNPVDKIIRALEGTNKEKPENGNMNEEEYKDHVYYMLQEAAKWSYESFAQANQRFSPSIRGEQIS